MPDTDASGRAAWTVLVVHSVPDDVVLVVAGVADVRGHAVAVVVWVVATETDGPVQSHEQSSPDSASYLPIEADRNRKCCECPHNWHKSRPRSPKLPSLLLFVHRPYYADHVCPDPSPTPWADN